MSLERQVHVPVMLEEVRDLLCAGSPRWFLDGTVGMAGHSAALLSASPEACLLGLDRDPEALVLAQRRLEPFGERARLVQAPFADVERVVEAEQVGPFDGILLDLGVSSLQLDRAERGFSFSRDGPLDMRMDPSAETTARDLLEELDEVSLANLIYELGEERRSRRIARAIVEARRARDLPQTTAQLAELVRRAIPRPRASGGGARGKQRRRASIHPATRTFQALRLAVNDELGQLERALPVLFRQLRPGGRLVVISFHSLEDRRVKQEFKRLKLSAEGRLLTKKPLQATQRETHRNPRARSAKLRAVERVA